VNNVENILELSGITKIYPGVVALDNVSMNVKRGEVHGLIGENGAGKSTLIKTLAGAHKPNSGEIYYDNNSYEYFLPHQAMELKIACIYQELNQVPFMSVMENIFLGRELYTKSGLLDLKKMEAETKSVLNEFELNINPHKQLGLLGVGTRQMLEICKAAHANSKLLIMDEPTASLSEKETKELFKIIEKLKNKGVTIIYISHRLEEVQYACDSLTVLRDGQVVIDGVRVNETSVDDMVSYMVGHDIKQKYPKKQFAIGEKVLEVKKLTSKGVFNDISFDVKKGELLGFAGLVGAGRTELMRAITGADPFDSGQIYIDGEKVTINTPKDSIEHGIAFLTEDRKGQGLILLQSVEFNSTLVHLNHFKNKGFLNLSSIATETKKLVKDLNFTNKFPTVKGYKDYKEMLKDNSIEAVVVASSTSTHASTVIDCIKANKKIFCEKPIAVNLEEAKEVQKVVDENDAYIQLGFMRRFDKPYAKAKAQILKGEMGKPVSLLAISRDPGCPPIEFAKHSGGLVNDMAIHDIDLCRWLMESEVKEVFAHGGVVRFKELGEIGDIDHVNISMIFENGKMALIEASRNSAYGYDIRTEVICENGAVAIGNIQDESTIYKIPNKAYINTIGGFLERFEEAYFNEINVFVENIINNIKPSVTAIDGLKAIQIADAINESLKTNKIVRL